MPYHYIKRLPNVPVGEKSPSMECASRALVLLGHKKKFECSNCKTLYHQICILKEHQIHIPNGYDDDLFACHDCFAVEDDTDDEYDTGIFKGSILITKMYLVLTPFKQTFLHKLETTFSDI
jgi:hypothetical protein